MFIFWLAVAAAFFVSVVSKGLVEVFLHDRVAILGSFAGLQYSLNSGVAFGLQLPPVIQEIFIFGALGFVFFLVWKSLPTPISQTGYGFIVGGAIANIMDRLSDGTVTDFFQIGTFPIFNVADSCITVGVMFLLAEMMGFGRSNRY